MRRRVAEQWNHFASSVLTDPKISAIQRTEMRRAFYAGALTLFHAVAGDMSEGEDTVTEDDEQILRDLAQEFKDYERDLRAGRA